MRQRASRDADANLKLLGGALRMLQFTARELAEHAGVKLETSRAFAEDNCGKGLFFERVGTATNDRGGRPANRYRLHPHGRDEILRRLTEVRRALVANPRSPTEPTANADASADFTPLALLESALEALATGEVTDPDEREALLEDARISLLGAKADFRAMIERRAEASELEDFAVRLRSAGTRLDTVAGVASEQKSVAVVEPETIAAQPHEFAVLAAVGPNLHNLFASFLEDWTAPLPLELEAICAPSLTGDDPQRLLAAALAGPMDSIFGSSILLRYARAAWTEDALREAVCDRILQLPADPDPKTLAKLAIAAASVDAVQAAEPLLRALLSPGVIARRIVDWEIWLACTRALARLARPRRAGTDGLRAAAACQYLLARRSAEPAELAVLVPAALSGLYPDAGKLMRRLADALFDRGGMKPALRGKVEEGAVARNLALAIQSSRFVILKEHIPDLLQHDSGRGLLLSLGARQHGALELFGVDEDVRFRISIGERVAGYLDLQTAGPESLPYGQTADLPFRGGTADLLCSVLTDRRWRPQRVRTGTFSAERRRLLRNHAGSAL